MEIIKKIYHNNYACSKFENLITFLNQDLKFAQYLLSARFSSEIEVLQLGLARNLHSSSSLEPEKSSSKSSLLSGPKCNCSSCRCCQVTFSQEFAVFFVLRSILHQFQSGTSLNMQELIYFNSKWQIVIDAFSCIVFMHIL